MKFAPLPPDDLSLLNFYYLRDDVMIATSTIFAFLTLSLLSIFPRSGLKLIWKKMCLIDLAD
jgi:hypothetical protein